MINEADFSALGLSEEMLAAVQAKGFETPTSIQRLTIPRLLSGENDIIAQSQTGTGKTAAFGLPILQQIEPSKEGVQSIILVPTRELAVQAAEELLSYNRERRLSITAIYGGAAMSEQLRRLSRRRRHRRRHAGARAGPHPPRYAQIGQGPFPGPGRSR
ncbi:MAG: DEAD/DEAH box helicase [Alistipes shahii]